MKINSDFKDLLRSLNAGGVLYLVVGGYAVMVHTEPRYTKDLDIWISGANPRRSFAAKTFSPPKLRQAGSGTKRTFAIFAGRERCGDRKSTRLNSSHLSI